MAIHFGGNNIVLRLRGCADGVRGATGANESHARRCEPMRVTESAVVAFVVCREAIRARACIAVYAVLLSTRDYFTMNIDLTSHFRRETIVSHAFELMIIFLSR